MSRKAGLWRGCALLLLLLWSIVVWAGESVSIVPIVAARQGNDWYRTTLVLRSTTGRAAKCEAAYSTPGNPQGGTLRGVYSVGTVPTVERNTMAEIGAIGTLRIVCNADVEASSFIERSNDGVTFRDAWVFSRIAEEPALRAGAVLPVTANHDVMIAEVSGHDVAVDVEVYGADGTVAARKRYSIPAFAQQIVNLSTVRQESSNGQAIRLDVSVTAGDGAVVVADEARTPELLAIVKNTVEGVAVARSTSAPTGQDVDALREIGAAAFKAAPFQDPTTGLVYMRNRWYDPTVGAFLTPDPMGYRDSANLYSYCGGDPVNCEDPTGLAASVSKSGVIIGARPDGTRYRIEPGTDSVTALRILESDADLQTAADQEDILARARREVPYSSSARPGETLMGPRIPSDRQYTHLPPGDGLVRNSIIATSGLPAQNRQQERVQGVLQIGGTFAGTVGGTYGSRGSVSAEVHMNYQGAGAVPVRVADTAGWTLPHRNRLDAKGPHDVYAITDANTGQVYHFGETGRGWETRGAEWRRKLAKEYGLETEAVPLKTQIPSKAAAKELETRYIRAYEKAFGQRPYYINESGEVIPIQKTRH